MSSARSTSIDSRPLRITQTDPHPKTPLPKQQKKPAKFRRPSRQQIIIAAGILVALALLVIIIQVTAASRANNPGFQTVSPNDKPVDQLGGWKRVSPPENDPVFSYTDHIDDVVINVSQQLLPKGFDQDTNSKIAELAKRFNATAKINTTSATAYVGTSSKGPQSVILAKRGLLILISSEKPIKNESWARYINSLE